MQNVLQSKRISTVFITKISVLSAMSVILYLFDFPLPIFPEFLKIDISDIPSIIGTIALGPIAGFFIELIKNLTHALVMGKTNGIGEIGNFIVGIAYVVPLGMVFKGNKNLKGYIVGALLGTVSMIMVACFINYYFLVPAYAKFYGAPIQYFVDMANKINSNVVTFKDYIFLVVVPFNLLKAIIISVVGYFVYVPLKKILSQ